MGKKYWEEYSNLQKVKHEIIKNYLGGWFPKLLLGEFGRNRVLYIDTHAGRGRHLAGNLGSPLIALDTLLNHRSKDDLLQKAEVRFIFMEHDEENLTALQGELGKYSVPEKVFVEPSTGDFESQFEDLFTHLDSNGRRLAPSFVFIDPFGFKISCRTLAKLLSYRGVELFINIMWRELDMAIQQGIQGTAKPGMIATLDTIFNGNGWRGITGNSADDRAEACAALYPAITSAKWGTYIRMKENNRTRYFLIHLSNHDAGRDLMKECIWKSCPDGGYYASKSDNPQQQLLIKPEPDLQPLRDWIVEQLADGPQRWSALTESLRAELWLSKHLNATLKELRKENRLTGEDHEGPFAATRNPLIRLAPRIKGRGLPPG